MARGLPGRRNPTTKVRPMVGLAVIFVISVSFFQPNECIAIVHRCSAAARMPLIMQAICMTSLVALLLLQVPRMPYSVVYSSLGPGPEKDRRDLSEARQEEKESIFLSPPQKSKGLKVDPFLSFSVSHFRPFGILFHDG